MIEKLVNFNIDIFLNYYSSNFLTLKFCSLSIFFNCFREGNHPDDFTRFTYRKLLQEVCRFANVLKMHGVNKGDRVAIYMPMIMETPIAMLACARIGAVHSIVVSTDRCFKHCRDLEYAYLIFTLVCWFLVGFAC